MTSICDQIYRYTLLAFLLKFMQIYNSNCWFASSLETLCSGSVVSVLDLMSFKWQASVDLFDSNTAYIFCETNALLP